MTPAERRAILTRACDLFNAGEYWLAHEALETVWRSIISDGDQVAVRVWQGLIQAAAALLHRERGNRHGVAVVGGSALEKLAGPEGPHVEIENVGISRHVARDTAGGAAPPSLDVRNDLERPE